MLNETTVCPVLSCPVSAVISSSCLDDHFFDRLFSLIMDDLYSIIKPLVLCLCACLFGCLFTC